MTTHLWLWLISSAISCVVGVVLAVLDGANIMAVAMVGACGFLAGINGATLYWVNHLRKNLH